MKLYIVRHGETQSNTEGRYCGSFESSLSEKGIYQCSMLNKKFTDIEFDLVFSSERERAKKTASIITDNRYKLTVDSRLNERDFGIFENRTYSEIMDMYKDQCMLWEKDWLNYRIPEGESVMDTFKRVSDFIRHIEKSDNENILVVTHGGIVRLFYCYILGNNIDMFWKFSSANADYSLLKYEYGNWYIDSINHI